MFDTVSATMAAAAQHRASAVALAFAAGAAASAGPCVAPRMIAAASFAGDRKHETVLRVLSLQAGLTAGYCALGAAASAIAFVTRHSMVVYAVLAAVLVACGIRTLLARPQCAHAPRRTVTLGAAFLTGASFALVVSPCCTPMVLGIGVFASSAAYGAVLLAAFSLGHGLPLAAIAFGAQRFRKSLVHGPLSACASCVNGTLLVALGAYYAVLA